jgi:hypothetical protein
MKRLRAQRVESGMALHDLRGWAARCRQLASMLDDQHAIKVMMDLARDLEAAAAGRPGAAENGRPDTPAPALPGKAERLT